MKINYSLFIDDERMPEDVTWVPSPVYKTEIWVIARSMADVQETIQYLGMPSLISFDHDLGEYEPTGYDIAKWLVEMCMDGQLSLPKGFQFLVHSKNPIGAKNISMYMLNFIRHEQL